MLKLSEMRIAKKILCITGGIFLWSCANLEYQIASLERYEAALKESEPNLRKTNPPSQAADEKGIELFKKFYAVFTAAEVTKEKIEELYAPDAFFRDGMRDVKGLKEITHYFLSSLEPIEDCKFEIHHVTRSDGETYFRWMMNLRAKRNPEELLRIEGMSHVRFGGDGKIVFHQDYWDTSKVFESAPVLGPVISHIKASI